MSGKPGAPRYWDAHTHLSAGAADLSGLDLRAAATIAAAVVDAVRGAPAGTWVRGWGWNGIDEPIDAAPNHPTFLARRDGHAAWVNHAARLALDLPLDRPVVAEAAFDAARSRLPERSAAERAFALRSRLHELVAFRVGVVDDMVEHGGPELYAVLRDRRELPIRVGMWLPDGTDPQEAEAIRRSFPPDDPMLATRGIKTFLDGSLSARTAALSRPYADDPGNCGELRMDAKAFQERVETWAVKGWPVAVHAIGDRAVGLALDILERVPRPAAGTHRIEHAQVVSRSDLPRFRAAGIVASVQPAHFGDDRGFLEARLGDRPEVVAHPLRSFATSGAQMVFGSDWPVSSWDPEAVLAGAVDGTRGDEALGADEAAAWYTSRPPWPTKSSSKGSSSTASTA